MSISIAFLFALTSGVASDPEMCSGLEREIVPDMQIQESDLSHAAAVAAMDKLQGRIERSEVTDDFQFGVLNQLKIVKGHVLLRQAQADVVEHGTDSPEAKDSRESFCKWLDHEGYWYD